VTRCANLSASNTPSGVDTMPLCVDPGGQRRDDYARNNGSPVSGEAVRRRSALPIQATNQLLETIWCERAVWRV
jgi:hypothetical protein